MEQLTGEQIEYRVRENRHLVDRFTATGDVEALAVFLGEVLGTEPAVRAVSDEMRQIADAKERIAAFLVSQLGRQLDPGGSISLRINSERHGYVLLHALLYSGAKDDDEEDRHRMLRFLRSAVLHLGVAADAAPTPWARGQIEARTRQLRQTLEGLEDD